MNDPNVDGSNVVNKPTVVQSSLFSLDSSKSNCPFNDYNSQVSKPSQEKYYFAEDIDDPIYDDSGTENKSN